MRFLKIFYPLASVSEPFTDTQYFSRIWSPEAKLARTETEDRDKARNIGEYITAGRDGGGQEDWI